jgi:hypothetical protein
MKKESQDRPAPPHLNIEKLLRTLEALSKENTRISRTRLDEIFRALRFELPYSSAIINAALAFALFADSPRNSADTTLNDVVIHLSKALINPTQVTGLAQAIQAYYQSRKKTESEYAAENIEAVLEANPLDAFPESSWEDLREMTLTVMDKIVSEKLARRIPGYKSQSVLELINPFLHFRLANTDLEKVKMAHPQVFKKWLTNIAHDGYEKINSEKKFTLILQEKEAAFSSLKAYIISKSQNKASLSRYIERISFSQKDKNKKIDSLNKILDEVLSEKSIIADSAVLLRARFYDNLRKLFATAEKNTAIYQSESSIQEAQNKAYAQIKNDLAAVEKILHIFTEFEKNYAKNLMVALLGRANLNHIRAILIIALLGPIVKKRDLNSGNSILVHDGGYPQNKLKDIITYLINELQKLIDNVTGMFSAAFKQHAEQAIQQLTALTTNLLPDEKFEAPSEAALETPALEINVEAVIAPPRVEIPEETPTVKKTFGPIPKSRFEMTEPIINHEPMVEPTEKTVEQAPVQETSKTPTAPEVSNELLETLVAPEPSNEPLETLDAQGPSNESSETQTAVEPINETPVEPVPVSDPAETPSEPELPDEDFDDEIIPVIEFEPVAFKSAGPEESMVSDPGLAIMNNYELSDFKEPVHEAWKTMLVKAVSAQPDVSDVNIIAQEQAANFYVICDLVQEVADINEDMLSPENKEMLISIQTLLLAALKDPLEENNWTFFEGARRNDVDRAIAILKS